MITLNTGTSIPDRHKELYNFMEVLSDKLEDYDNTISARSLLRTLIQTTKTYIEEIE